jgi:hypothetical protein
MNEYVPEEWVLVKIGGTDPHYRVFGSWRGGYLDGDSWRMNSGIVDCQEYEDEEGYYSFIGHSGSTYLCHKESYGIGSPYNMSVLQNYCERSGGHMEIVMELTENPLHMDWIISK